MACKRLVRFFFFIFLVFILIYGGRKLLLSSIFTIKIVDIKIDGDISKPEIKRLWNRFIRQSYPNSMPNIFRLNRKALMRVLLSDVRIDSVGIKIYPPDKLIIFVRERKPFVWIKENLGVDKNGIVFPIKGTKTLMHLLGFEEKKEGDTIDVSLLFPILTIAKKYPFFPMIKETKIDGKKIFFSLDNITVCIPKDIKGAYRRFKKLDTILKKDISNIRLIDLNYEDVILSP